MSFVDAAVKCSVDTLNTNREIEPVTEIPRHWRELMDKAGYTSIRQLAKAAGLNHTVVNPVIMKGTSTNPDNMAKIAAVLSTPVEELYFIKSGTRNRPLTLPKGTEKLTERQKDAVSELIRSMIEEKEQNEAKFVDKKTVQSTEHVQEKTTNVTPLGDRPKRIPPHERFEKSGRKVARIMREIPEDLPRIPDETPNTRE